VSDATGDPVRRRRHRAARLAAAGQRLGYALFGVAMVLFLIGFAGSYTPGLTTAIVVALVAGSLVLAPAIVLGYAVRAAERDDPGP
jgi:hypothetical protein